MGSAGQQDARDSGEGPPARAPRGPLRFALGFLIAGAFYMVLIDTTDLAELYAGAAVTVIAAGLFLAAREERFEEAAVRVRWLLHGARVFARVPADIGRLSLAALGAAVLRPRDVGVLRAVPFAHGGEHPKAVGRRALVLALGSMAPNTIPIGVDPDRDLLLVHQLRRSGGRDAIDVIGEPRTGGA